jgi:putative addiction module component (TIGR02574 family)
MPNPMRQVLAEALALPPVDRAELIEELFISFDGADRKLLDQLWAEEAESRLDAFQRGEFSAKPTHEVFSRLNK